MCKFIRTILFRTSLDFALTVDLFILDGINIRGLADSDIFVDT